MRSELSPQDIEQATKRGARKSNRRERAYQTLSLVGGMLLFALALFIFSPAMAANPWWLGSFMILGLLPGLHFYVHYLYPKSAKRIIDAVAKEVKEEARKKS